MVQKSLNNDNRNATNKDEFTNVDMSEKRDEKGQTNKSIKRKSSYKKNSDIDDSTTIAPSITYSRNDKTFGTSSDAPTIFDTDDKYDDINDIYHFGISHDKHHNKISLSDERLISSQLSQWNYNNNKIALHRSILQVNDILSEIDLENEKRPIFIKDEEELYVLNLNIKLDGNYSNNTKSDMGLDKESLAKLFKVKIESALNHLKSLQQRVDDVSSKVFITGDVNTGKSSFCNSLLQRRLLPEDQLPCTNVFCEIIEARENNNVEEIHAIYLVESKDVKDSILRYDVRNKSTYEIHSLQELPELVHRKDRYSLLKIYIKDDKRNSEESLLRNGTVDISLIDSPGLNMDSIQTAEVMTRQEEIDLVVFVVNAENQLTLSAQDFIKAASHEKKLMFFVIKKFDRIRDKERCKKLILKQIQDLSPETYKNAPDFIHFLELENNRFPDGDGDGSDDDNSDDDNDDDKKDDPSFDHLENSLRNFILKRRSVAKLLPAKTYLCKLLSDIEKIATSNLTMFTSEEDDIDRELSNVSAEVRKIRNHYDRFIGDIDRLIENVTTQSYSYTKDTISKSLDIPLTRYPPYTGISQIYDYIIATEHFIREQIKRSVISSEKFARDETEINVSKIYSIARNELNSEFMEERVFDRSLMFERNFHLSAKRLSVTLKLSDLYAPSWENFIEYLGFGFFNPMKLLGWKSKNNPSDSNVSKDLTTTNIHAHENNNNNTETDSVANALSMSKYSFGQYLSQPSLLFTSKLPALAIYSFGGTKIINFILLNGLKSFSLKTMSQISGSLILAGSLLGVSYLVYDLPRALPINLSRRYQEELREVDYVHINSQRISKEVNEVLRIPSREIVKTCESLVSKKESAKNNLEEKRAHNKISLVFFNNLLQRTTAQRTIVDSLNLDVD